MACAGSTASSRRSSSSCRAPERLAGAGGPGYRLAVAAPVPIVLGVDVEPDSRTLVPGDRLALDGFAACVTWLENLRPRLEDATGRPVRFTWFLRMDPQIEALTGGPDALAASILPGLRRLQSRGDALGLHTHAGRWDAARRRWVVDHGDPAWVAHCARTAFASYAATFGEPCRRHRYGDRFTSRAALDLAAGLGARVDLTVEPGKPRTARVDVTAPATGEIPSSLHLRSEPMRHGDTDLWLLPLTAGDPGPALPWHIRTARRIRFAGQPLRRPLTLYRPYRTPDAYWDAVEETLSGVPTPYVALVVRSDLPLRPEMAYARPIMEALLHTTLVRRLRFADPLDVVEDARTAAAGWAAGETVAVA